MTDPRFQLTVDARLLSTGIGTYTLNILSRLKSCGEIDLKALTLPQHEVRLQPICDRVEIVNAPIYSIREQIQVPLAARHDKLLHVPHYNAPLLYGGTLLVSIHDLTHLLDHTLRRTLKSKLYARPMLHAVARKAAHILTVSEYSKRQIVKVLNVSPEKITVAYNGVGPQFRPSHPQEARERLRSELNVDGSYLLYVGNLKPHKNVSTLLRAYADLRKRNAIEQRLLVVGDDRVGASHTADLARQLNIEEFVRFLPHVTHELLPSVYAGADLLVLPSFEEGFGLPVIEAMACGTPVVCSNAASLPEVAGDAAIMFDPNSVEKLTEAIGTVLGSPALQAELRDKGFSQARRFDWQECTRRHYEIYRRFS